MVFDRVYIMSILVIWSFTMGGVIRWRFLDQEN